MQVLIIIKKQPMRILLFLILLNFAIVNGQNTNVIEEGQKSPTVIQDRLEQRIFDLAKFGLQENGDTERVAFSDADIEARKWIIETLEALKLNVHIDYAGNIIGKREGKDPSKKLISFGSHIDRVPNLSLIHI